MLTLTRAPQRQEHRGASCPFEILRAMSGERRLLAFEMSLFARGLAKERIRREHPEWSEASVARELLRLAFFPAPLPAWIP